MEHVRFIGGVRHVYKFEFRNRPKGKRQHGRHACLWEDNIKIDLK
jgi:hypothetical protein